MENDNGHGIFIEEPQFIKLSMRQQNLAIFKEIKHIRKQTDSNTKWRIGFATTLTLISIALGYLFIKLNLVPIS